MGTHTVNDLDHCFAKVIEVFADLGYPQKVIEQWTLPQRDAETIIKIIKEYRPRHILEVGTFVGLTTLLMALVSSPETHIHTIDPNFPLQSEMESMQSKLYGRDGAERTQELAHQAASRLGIENKITFHTGGFSTDNTFASYNTSPSSRVTIVGPEVCKCHGPFDFIFIDGLHYEEDVFSDVNLAAEHLMPSGLIALHDVMGPWGSNVRRAIYRFLDKRDNFVLSHGKYSELYDSIGLLKYNTDKLEFLKHKNDTDISSTGLIQEKMFKNLSAVLVNMFSPLSAIQIGGDITLLEHMKNFGISDVCAYVPPSQGNQYSSVPVKQLNLSARNHFEKKYDLCLCIGVMDSIPAELADNVIQACVDASDTIIFASTPPGEMGFYQNNNKPLAYWIKKFLEKGYLFCDVIRPILEPINFSDLLLAEYQQNSSYLMNLYLVKKENRINLYDYVRSFLEEIIFSKERRIEDLQLQNLYQKCLLTEIRKQYVNLDKGFKSLNSEYQRLNGLYDSINIFNKKVIQNTFNRIKEIFKLMLFENKK